MQGLASITVTGITVPLGPNSWVMPTFLPNNAFSISSSSFLNCRPVLSRSPNIYNQLPKADKSAVSAINRLLRLARLFRLPGLFRLARLFPVGQVISIARIVSGWPGYFDFPGHFGCPGYVVKSHSRVFTV